MTAADGRANGEQILEMRGSALEIGTIEDEMIGAEHRPGGTETDSNIDVETGGFDVDIRVGLGEERRAETLNREVSGQHVVQKRFLGRHVVQKSGG